MSVSKKIEPAPLNGECAHILCSKNPLTCKYQSISHSPHMSEQAIVSVKVA